MRFFILFLFTFCAHANELRTDKLLLRPTAAGTCSKEGQIVVDSDDSDILKYCDGTNWYAIVKDEDNINTDQVQAVNSTGLVLKASDGTTVATAGESDGATLEVEGAVQSNTSLVLQDPGAGTNAITIDAPDGLASSYALELPGADGSGGQVLSTNGSGILSWASPATNPMDSEGDMIVGGASGAATKLDSGADQTFLYNNGANTPAWIGNVVLGGGNIVTHVGEIDCDATPAVVGQIGSWLGTPTQTATGRCTAVFSGSTFSSAPYCTFTGQTTGNLDLNVYEDTNITRSVTAFGFRITSGTTDVNGDVIIRCTGLR